MLSAIGMSAYVWFIDQSTNPYLGLFALGMAAFIVFTHRSNISRMVAGTESRNARLWLLGRRH